MRNSRRSQLDKLPELNFETLYRARLIREVITLQLLACAYLIGFQHLPLTWNHLIVACPVQPLRSFLLPFIAQFKQRLLKYREEESGLDKALLSPLLI